MNLGSNDLTNISEFGRDLLSPGEYRVAISNAELKEWPSGDKYLSLWYKVQEGPRTGAVCFDSLSLWDSDPKFQNMAFSRLKSIRKALGLNPNIPGDTDELLGKALTIKVSIRSKDGKDYQNINSYKPIGAAGASIVQPAQAPVPPQAQPQPSSQMPW